MSKPVITVKADDSMQKATELLKEHNIRILPVMEIGKLVGIITRDDMLKVLVNMTGVDKRGIQFALQVEDRAQSIHEFNLTS
jgi:acetoin utilization protein AcuB